MIAQNLFTSLSSIKSNVFSCTRLATHVRYFHPLQCPSLRLRHKKHSVFQLQLSSSKPRIASNFISIRNTHSGTYHGIDTNISNNLMLWKINNIKYFRNLKIFLGVQSVVLTAFTYVLYTFLPSIDKYETYKDYCMDNPILLITICLPLTIIFGSILVVWFFETRSLKYIILNKGGRMVTLVSFHPIKGTKSIVVPVDDVSVAKSRTEVGAYMSLKVKTKKLYYLIDKDGIFVNPQMFDVTVAAS